MPIHNTVDLEFKTVVSRATGHITLEDLRVYFAAVWTEPEYRGFSEIFDWTGVSRVDLSVGELRSLAGAAHGFHSSTSASKLAIVATGKDGLRMAQTYRTLREVRGPDAPEIRVFEDTASARAWLGMPPEPEAPAMESEP